MSHSAEIRQAIVDEAKTWLETPYHHQGRVKGVGVDCAQLVAGIAEALGFIEPGTAIPHDYSPEWHIHNREEVLLANLRAFGCTEVEAPELGDILCFKYGRAVGHLGIYAGDGMMVHAAIQTGRVVLNTLSPNLLKRHVYTYTFPPHPYLQGHI